MYYFITFLCGILLTVMVTLNGKLSVLTSTTQSVFIVHVIAIITLSIIMIFKKDQNKKKEKVPFYYYIGGAFSVFVIFFNIICFEKLGISLTVAITFLSQTVISSIIDHFGILGMKKIPFNKNKLVGLSLITAGVLVMIVV